MFASSPGATASCARFTEVNEDYRHQHQDVLVEDGVQYGGANTEPDLAGYEIVWRDTTEPLWTHSRFVGNVTSYTVGDITKDNFHFGVRAVDRAGNRSTVRFPGGVLDEE